MPWEKTFEESDVIDQAMQVFWDKGYADTSISDITAATGIKRGSLYNAFEGKRELFIKSLMKYDNDKRRALLARLNGIDDPREAIAKFFDHIVKVSLSDSKRRGCMLVNTAVDYSHHDAEIQRVVDEAFKDLTTFFEQKVRRTQELGALSATANPKSIAKGLLSAHVGIRVLGRGAFGKAALEQIAEQAKRLLA